MNLNIDQGATFIQNIEFKGSATNVINLPSYGAKMQIRRSINDPTVILELTTYNGRIILEGSRVLLGSATGNIGLRLTSAETTALSGWGMGVYDIFIKADARVDWDASTGDVTRVTGGNVVLTLGVTR
jgi:hypothetical protein